MKPELQAAIDRAKLVVAAAKRDRTLKIEYDDPPAKMPASPPAPSPESPTAELSETQKDGLRIAQATVDGMNKRPANKQVKA